ncbi:MAG: hypothetical protein JO290_03190 [Sphingomonadaceae bacterium]|nr:hypothetical protein [Sphingomonadaceae bacterium]
MRRLPLVLALAAAPAAAGPPYVTDDPQPTDLGHYEIYFFASATQVPGSTAGAGGVDFNYGGLTDVQLTAVVPLAFDTSPGGRRVGAGNVELAVKYKFLHQKADGIDLSLFPRLFVPAGGQRFGTGQAALLLPLWAERDWGKWSLFGGGGWQLNPGGRNFWSGGVALSRALGERASVGAEVYHHGPDARDARSFTGLNLGATYRLSKHWSLIGAAGPGVENARDGGLVSAYVALKADL